MNRLDMMRLAEKAGWQYVCDDPAFNPLWKFAELVIAAEREECAADIERIAETIPSASHDGYVYKTVTECATVIRARGQS